MATPRKKTVARRITKNIIREAPARPPEDSAVRVRVSPDVIYNLDKYRAVTRKVIDKLGCPKCHSALDLRFEAIRDFKVGPRGTLAVLGGSEPGPVGSVVDVNVPAAVLYDYEKLDRVRERVLGKLGCGNCHSGFDIRFRSTIRTFNVDAKLNVKGL